MSDISDSVYCLGRAMAVDLPDIEDHDLMRRPYSNEVDVYSFPQGWSSTALGFGGIGGQSITTAQTTVVISNMMDAAVYFGRGLAYVVKGFNSSLIEDIAKADMAACNKKHKYFTQVANRQPPTAATQD